MHIKHDTWMHHIHRVHGIFNFTNKFTFICSISEYYYYIELNNINLSVENYDNICNFLFGKLLQCFTF